MKVAVACDGTEVSPHFGRCQRYLIADLQGADITLIEWLESPGHEPGVLPELMREKGVELVVAGGAGPRAQGLFAAAGIEFVGGATGEALQVLQALAQGTFVPGQSACTHGWEG
jgi:predicted Fe-Mo cluster-binding NifX family protein